MLTTNDVARCERWFEAHGLPYFIDARHERIRRALTPAAIALWSVIVLLVGAAAFGALRLAGVDSVVAFALALLPATLTLIARGVVVFDVVRIARWALVHAWQSMRLLLPLLTRALPFLLLFTTFLFINTEVWQVASSLSRARLVGALGCFAVLAVGFLWPSFAGEIDRLGSELSGEELTQTCAGTPVASAAREIAADPRLAQQVASLHLPRLQRGNLMLMLFITQAVQLLLVALLVFGYFCIFGSLVIRPSVIESWTGQPAHFTGPFQLISDELFAVAVFLSGFAGLYFTVQAVTDQNYRREFFHKIEDDLQQAMGVSKVYTALRRHLAVASTGDDSG
ncbi:hypothetical protein [Nostocoides sp.]|uniref:hypothetical protein n=1 Tax=Nostocoides sp. TaxID=1917966 RepID=UPI002B9AF957|nr:hypothetical protein [Tetrasphaera sp.]